MPCIILPDGLHLFGSTHSKGILPPEQLTLRKREAAPARALFPFIFAFGKIKIALRRAVGIHNDLGG